MPIKRVVKKSKELAPRMLRAGKFHIKKIYVSVIFVALAVIMFSLRGFLIAATVNGKPIYRLGVIRELEAQSGATLLDSLITRELIKQEALKNAIVVSQEEVRRDMQTFEKNLSDAGTTLDQALASQGMTREDLIEQITVQKQLEALLSDNISVSDSEVEDFITQNKDNLPKDTNTEELSTQVRNQLKQQKLSREIQSWMQRVKSEANIKYFGSYNPTTPTAF